MSASTTPALRYRVELKYTAASKYFAFVGTRNLDKAKEIAQAQLSGNNPVYQSRVMDIHTDTELESWNAYD